MSTPSSSRGFTLLEMLVVLCILGCLLAMLLPNLYPADRKSQFIKALNQCKAVSDAMMQYTIVEGGTARPDVPFDPTAYPNVIPPTDLEDELSPDFLTYVPETDPWGNPWEHAVFALGSGGPGSYDVTGPLVYMVRSPGPDGTLAGGPIDPGPFEMNDPSVDDDIICADGQVIRWPQGWYNGP